MFPFSLKSLCVCVCVWWCILGRSVEGHSVTTNVFECRCWDAHTHGPTPAPKYRYIFPPAITSQTHSKKTRKFSDKTRDLYEGDSYDY